MSTLKTSNIQDTSGNNNSTPEEIGKGRAKAWVNFNGSLTVAIRNSFNVSSITDNGTGDYTLNFTNALANANYTFAGSVGMTSNTTTVMFTVELPDGVALSTSMTTSSLRVNVVFVNSGLNRSNSDREFVSVTVFGD